eukprot:TRINITY_DN37376_c0_g1_i1.p1 TRINITY_DN37376_c0_g1~~TRINITY_DN37376_c0_g1_i1.p1  ORF type:complete len:389 (+),score=50.87 TRINITY_DN37376_c0_g1_i1:27-1169(+)
MAPLLPSAGTPVLGPLDLGRPPSGLGQRCEPGESRAGSSSSSCSRGVGSLPPPRPPSRHLEDSPALRPPAPSLWGEGDVDIQGSSLRRPWTDAVSKRRPQALSLSSGSIGSLKACLSDPVIAPLDSPAPDRNTFRKQPRGVAVVIFDFDGTLTATPGHRASRGSKATELRARANLLGPRLAALRDAGAMLGIISKSTEVTVRDALASAGLAAHFDGPIVGKAVGFEGKAGFIMSLLAQGALSQAPRAAGSGRGRGSPEHILLVDDDVLELERAAARGIQVYGAPADGGLVDDDLQAIVASVRKPLSTLPPALRGAAGRRPLPQLPGSRGGSVCAAGRLAGSTLSPLRRTAWRRGGSLIQGRAPGKWRTNLLFSGEYIEGC